MVGADKVKVLLVEDDDRIGTRLVDGLRATSQYSVRWSRTGGSALLDAESVRPDVVLLDLGLPDLDGLEVARTLRARQPDLLIMVLTARDEDIDVIAGLDAGADDYLTKPFGVTVLLARLRAHLRRRPAAQEDAPAVQIADLTVDPASRRCHMGAIEIPLRVKEFDLLLALALRSGQAVTREQLMAEVWDENWHGSTKTLDVTLASLRRRLGEARLLAPTARLPTISTLRGHGYRLDAP